MSTVHICLKDILGVSVKCEVIFYPGDTPFQNGAALAVSGRRSVWLDAQGNGETELLAGSYAVRFGGITGNTDTLIIQVPDDTATHELTALITAGNWALPMRDWMQREKNLADVADAPAAFAAIKQAATSAATGVVALATQAEVDAGSDTAKAVTPATLAGAAAVASLATTLATKADATAVASLATTLATKADATAVANLATILATKADAASLAAKADASALAQTVTVADSAALFALGKSDVKVGDRVVVTAGDTGTTEYYEVIDTANLGGHAAFGTLRNGPLSFDADKIKSNGNGAVIFNGPDGIERMRMSGTEYQDFLGVTCASISMSNDGAAPVVISSDLLGDLLINAPAVKLTTPYISWGTYLSMSVIDDTHPGIHLASNRLVFLGVDNEIGAIAWDGLYLNGSFGVFGKTPVQTQPSAITNATDLASAITAINAWLVVARKYGLIKSS